MSLKAFHITFFSIIISLSITYGQSVTHTRLLEKSNEALTFCKKNNYNTSFCILVDMSIHSGKNRIFVWDFNTKDVLKSGLCSHGCCDNEWGADETKDNPTFSNTNNSHCSSLGKYKIGKKGYSDWGIHINYKLHGLESSNSNAFMRYIVLHSWEMVANKEVFPNGTPEGWGCPAVSNSFMRFLDEKLLGKEKPILFWIFK